MQFKILVQADSFQTLHREGVRRQSYDPAEAFVCLAVDFPADEGERTAGRTAASGPVCASF
jgi:hypothetical protein